MYSNQITFSYLEKHIDAQISILKHPIVWWSLLDVTYDQKLDKMTTMRQFTLFHLPLTSRKLQFNHMFPISIMFLYLAMAV